MLYKESSYALYIYFRVANAAASRVESTLWTLLTNWIRTNMLPSARLLRLVDREWVCRPPHYSPPRINSISSEYILSFHLSSPMHSQYYSPNHGY